MRRKAARERQGERGIQISQGEPNRQDYPQWSRFKNKISINTQYNSGLKFLSKITIFRIIIIKSLIKKKTPYLGN